jgi:hypothetical protein
MPTGPEVVRLQGSSVTQAYSLITNIIVVTPERRDHLYVSQSVPFHPRQRASGSS